MKLLFPLVVSVVLRLYSSDISVLSSSDSSTLVFLPSWSFLSPLHSFGYSMIKLSSTARLIPTMMDMGRKERFCVPSYAASTVFVDVCVCVCGWCGCVGSGGMLIVSLPRSAYGQCTLHVQQRGGEFKCFHIHQ